MFIDCFITYVCFAFKMNVLVEYYKKLAAKEQHDREKLKLKKKSYMHITSSSFASKVC